MLAYLFWHRPRASTTVESYEQAQIAFHRSLARSPPVGMRASAIFRVGPLPWPAVALGVDAEQSARAEAVYEDWYLIEDFTALGVLNEAAVGRGHRSAHDEAARRFGGGAGGLYGLLEGELDADSLAGATLATWVARPAGAQRRALGELLGDGMDPRETSLWRRQLVLGPAPEFCLLGDEPPAGVAPARLPDGWTATAVAREVLWHG